MDVQVRGLAELERAWPAFARRDTEAVRQVALAVAGIAADQTRVRVPRRTGALAASVLREDTSGGLTPTSTVSIGEGLPYGRWIEFGKRKRGRAPRTGRYLIPTARRQVRTLKKRAAQTTQQTIGRFPWPNPRP
jgi:hypothetical protein